MQKISIQNNLTGEINRFHLSFQTQELHMYLIISSED